MHVTPEEQFFTKLIFAISWVSRFNWFTFSWNSLFPIVKVQVSLVHCVHQRVRSLISGVDFHILKVDRSCRIRVDSWEILLNQRIFIYIFQRCTRRGDLVINTGAGKLVESFSMKEICWTLPTQSILTSVWTKRTES